MRGFGLGIAAPAAAAAAAAALGCGGGAATGTAVPLRAACTAGSYWNGGACVVGGAAPAKVAAAAQAIDALDLDAAKLALEEAEKAGPLDHETNVKLWEERGIAAAYVDDQGNARAAFDMLLALDPGHLISYKLSPKATFLFEDTRRADKRSAPAIDVSWARGGKVGDPVPLGIEVLADPKQLLRKATVFVRTRGEGSWRAADVTLGGAKGEQRVVLPAVEAEKPVSLELYVRAYDDKGNEVLTWADPLRPREIPLRYEPPTPWYKTWWGITAVGAVVAVGVGVTVYELTIAPPDKIDGSATVK